MFDDDSNQRNDNDRGQKKPPGGFKVPTSTWLVWIAILGGILALVLVRGRMSAPGEVISEPQFWQLENSNQIVSASHQFHLSIHAAYPHYRHLLQNG